MFRGLISTRLRILVLIMFLWAIFVVGWASFHHLAYGGPYSGTVEAILTFVLMAILYLIYKTERYEQTSMKYKLYRRTGLFLIFAIAATLLPFGIYHYSTPTGFRSGVTEMSMAVYLIVLDVLTYIAYKRPLEQTTHNSYNRQKGQNTR